jgi:RNA polymerase sigma-70 factor, ECF subfamily
MVDTAVVDDVVERARNGDRDALGMLWRSHHHLLLRYFRGRGASAPEDLASQVWIDVARGLSGFVGDEDDFRRWLFTIARRRHIDALRARSRRPEEATADAGADRHDPAATAALESGDSLERALAMVRRLPDDMAEAVMLRVIADLDVGRVAEIMGRREGHVRVLVHRGLKKLADQLAVTRASDQPM